MGVAEGQRFYLHPISINEIGGTDGDEGKRILV